VNERELRALEEGEAALRLELKRMAAEMGEVESVEDITSNAASSKLHSPPDQACIKGEFAEFQLSAYRHIAEGLEGWVDDDFAFYDDWGFDLPGISVPVFVWQGEQDNIIPVAHTKWLAQRMRIPAARYRLLSSEGHVSLMTRRYGEILDELTDRQVVR